MCLLFNCINEQCYYSLIWVARGLEHTKPNSWSFLQLKKSKSFLRYIYGENWDRLTLHSYFHTSFAPNVFYLTLHSHQIRTTRSLFEDDIMLSEWFRIWSSYLFPEHVFFFFHFSFCARCAPTSRYTSRYKGAPQKSNSAYSPQQQVDTRTPHRKATQNPLFRNKQIQGRTTEKQ